MADAKSDAARSVKSQLTISKGKRGTTIRATGTAAQALFDAIERDVMKGRQSHCPHGVSHLNRCERCDP